MSEPTLDAQGRKYVQSRPRKNKSRRPAVTFPSPWPALVTPLEEARGELPFAVMTTAEAELAHGVSTNTMPELEEIAALQFLSLPNKPVVSDERPLPTQKVPSQLPRKGSCSDLFQSFTFNHLEHGEYVRTRLRQLKGNKRSRDAKWTLTPDQIVFEIINWYKSMDKDFKDAKIWLKNGAVGTFKPKTKLFIIPPEAMQEWAVEIVWDTAAWFAATPEERKLISIVPQDWSVAAKNPWQTDIMKKWAQDSGFEDHACMQNLHEIGTFLPFTGSWATMLTPPAAGFFPKMDVGSATTYEEIALGWLTEPLMGLHFIPGKQSSRNVARIWRSGKIKDRGTANFSCPDKLSLHFHSVNAGYDVEGDLVNFPPLKLTCPNMIAFNMAIIMPPCGSRFCVCKNDWVRNVSPSPVS